MRRTITIEIKAVLADDQYEALKAALVHSVRTIFATAQMIGQDKPMVAMRGEDFFNAPEEIDIMAQDPDYD